MQPRATRPLPRTSSPVATEAETPSFDSPGTPIYRQSSLPMFSTQEVEASSASTAQRAQVATFEDEGNETEVEESPPQSAQDPHLLGLELGDIVTSQGTRDIGVQSSSSPEVELVHRQDIPYHEDEQMDKPGEEEEMQEHALEEQRLQQEEEDLMQHGDEDVNFEDDESLIDDRRRQSTLSRRKEQYLVDWLQAHPMIYDKSLKDYKNKEKKLRAWRTVADDLGKTPEELQRWFTTKRTQYGKLKRGKKSGSGRVQLTENEKFILRNFQFLDPFILRQRPTIVLGAGEVIIHFFVCKCISS